MGLTPLSLVTTEKSNLRFYGHCPFAWPGRENLPSGTLRWLTIHTQFLKGEHRRHLKSPLTALPYTFYPTSLFCGESLPFQEGNGASFTPSQATIRYFCQDSRPSRVLGHTCPALALPTRKWWPPSLCQQDFVFFSSESPGPGMVPETWHPFKEVC